MRYFVLLLACFAVLCVQPAEAATISYQAVADGMVYSSDGGTHWNDPTTGPYFESFLNDPYVGWSAVEFNIDPSAHSGETIVSATLYLYADIYDENIGVHGYVGDGKITLADFDLTFPENTTFDPDAVNEVPVTAIVSSLFADGKQYVGFQLRELVNGESTVFYSSSDKNDKGLRPRLDIEYGTGTGTAPVPEPSTLLLLGSGLAGFVGFGRRRLKK